MNSSTWATSVGLRLQLCPASISPTNGNTRYPVTNVPTGGSAPISSTADGSSPISSSRLPQRGRAQVLVGLVLASSGERDLARVAAEVRAALGEHGGERVAVERHQHRRVLRARRVHVGRLLGRQE